MFHFVSRTTLRKLCSLCVIIVVVAFFGYFIEQKKVFGLSTKQRLFFGLCMVILLNLSTMAYQKVFAARRLVRRGQFVKGAELAQQFVHDMETKPWKRLACQLGIEAYTTKPEVLGYMCMANAFGLAGDLDAAFATYLKATQLDPLCPTAFLGLARISVLLGKEEQAEVYVLRSRELGFKGSASDRFFMLAGALTERIGWAFSNDKKNR